MGSSHEQPRIINLMEALQASVTSTTQKETAEGKPEKKMAGSKGTATRQGRKKVMATRRGRTLPVSEAGNAFRSLWESQDNLVKVIERSWLSPRWCLNCKRTFVLFKTLQRPFEEIAGRIRQNELLDGCHFHLASGKP
jgi:hypothetical protein